MDGSSRDGVLTSRGRSSHKGGSPSVFQKRDVNNGLTSVHVVHVSKDGNDEVSINEAPNAGTWGFSSDLHVFELSISDPDRSVVGVRPKSSADAYSGDAGFVLNADDINDTDIMMSQLTLATSVPVPSPPLFGAILCRTLI